MYRFMVQVRALFYSQEYKVRTSAHSEMVNDSHYKWHFVIHECLSYTVPGDTVKHFSILVITAVGQAVEQYPQKYIDYDGLAFLLRSLQLFSQKSQISKKVIPKLLKFITFC